MRVRASGARTWIYQYKVGGRTRRLVLGQRHGGQAWLRAREIAGELHAKVRLGGDPAAEKREQCTAAPHDTFGVTWSTASSDQYHRAAARPWRRSPGIFADVQRRRSTPCRSVAITLRDVADLLTRLEKSSGFDHRQPRPRHAVRTVFGWAMRGGAGALQSRGEHQQTRTSARATGSLSNDELKRIWNADRRRYAYGTIIKLLILTGQRRSEITELRWP